MPEFGGSGRANQGLWHTEGGGSTMYESFFGFKEKPFNITPDPRFLYLSEKHREALAHLVHGVKEKQGFVVLSGEVGTGKTTIVRALLERMDENYQFAYILNPNLPVTDFLRYICHDFGLQANDGSKIDYLIKLHDFLIESHNDGKTSCLIIDEGQNIDPSVFEEIRMLTNLETSNQRLFQIFLVGQPELNSILEQTELWQLKQRISTRYHLLPLDELETREYIQTRMRIAGAKRLNCFTQGAIQRIYGYSQGVPRLINTICNNSLLSGYAKDTPIINEKMIRECATDLRLDRVPKDHKLLGKTNRGSQGKRSLAYGFAAIILAGLLGLGTGSFFWTKSGVPLDLSKAAVAIWNLFQGSHKVEATGIILEKGGRTDGEERIIAPQVDSDPALPVGAQISGPNSATESQDEPTEENGTFGAIQTTGLVEAEAVRTSLLEAIERSKDKELFEVANGPESSEIRIVIARKGDTISQIIFREFGRVDAHLLQATQRLNPAIEDLDQIFVGQKVSLPADPRKLYENPGLQSYFSVHVASFKKFDQADEMFAGLMEIGEKPTIIPVKIQGRGWYRVTIGEHKSFRGASRQARELIQRGEYSYAEPIKVPELKQLTIDSSATK